MYVSVYVGNVCLTVLEDMYGYVCMFCESMFMYESIHTSPQPNTNEYTHVHSWTYLPAGAVEYTDCTVGKPLPYKCPVYDTKQSNGDAPVMLEFWGVRSTLLLPSLPGSLWPGVVAPDRALSMGQIELTAYLC